MHGTIKQYQMDVMRLGQRATEISKYDKGAQLERKIEKKDKDLLKLTTEVTRLQEINSKQKAEIDAINQEKEYFAQQAFELNKHFSEMKQFKLKQL